MKKFAIRSDFLKNLSFQDFIELESYAKTKHKDVFKDTKRPKYFYFSDDKCRFKVNYYTTQEELKPSHKLFKKFQLEGSGKLLDYISVTEIATAFENMKPLNQISLKPATKTAQIIEKIDRFSLKDPKFVYNSKKMLGKGENRKKCFSEILDVKTKETEHDFVCLDCEFVEINSEGTEKFEFHNRKNSQQNLKNETAKFSSKLTVESKFGNTKFHKAHLARITVIDSSYKILMDDFIAPAFEIVNLHTKYSGITKENLEKAISIEKFEEKLNEIIGTNTFILGHSLSGDLVSMGLYHEKIVDTSFNYLGADGNKISLKILTKKFLSREIQEGSHNSLEDCKATLDLFRLKFLQSLPSEKKVRTVQNIKNLDKFDFKTKEENIDVIFDISGNFFIF